MHDIEDIEKEVINAHKALENFAMFLTKNEELADDLLQETLLRILSNISKYENLGCFLAWAKCIMKNIFLNERVSSEKHRRTFVDGYDYINDDSVHPFTCENDEKYSKEDVEKAISLLPPRYAQIIRMQMEGYKYEEIAKTMNLTINCVKSTIFSAKNRLKKILEQINDVYVPNK